MQTAPKTETDVKRLKPVTKEQWYGFGNGLYLRHSAPHLLTWVYRTKAGGKQQKVKLGTHPAMSLAAARAACAKLGATALPDQVRAETVCNEWYDRVIVPTYKQTKNASVYVNRFNRFFGHRMIGSLTTAELTNNLIDYGKQYPVAANRCRSSWALMFGYARQRGLISVNPLAETSNAVAGGTETARARVLTDEEITWVMALQDDHGKLLRFLLLTGLRISEAQTAKVGQLDGDVLHIPENKSDRPHWVAVSPLAREQLGDYGGFLFFARGVTATQAWLKRQDVGWTPHDLRRTFATRLAGMQVAPHVIEKCLNHTLGGVLATYNRHDYAAERTAATLAWSESLAGHAKAN